MGCVWKGEWRGAFEQNLCEVKSVYDYIGIEDKCWVGHGGGYVCMYVGDTGEGNYMWWWVLGGLVG